MRIPRPTIAALMAAVAFVAVAGAALRSRSAPWNAFAFPATCTVLLLAVVAAAARGGRRRARPLAFALFGSAYLALCTTDVDLVIWPLVIRLYHALDPPPPPAPSAGGSFSDSGCFGFLEPGVPGAYLVDHCLIGLAVAAVAGLIAPLLLPKDAPMNADRTAPPGGRRWPRRAAPAALVALAGGAVLVGLSRAPDLTAAATFLGTGGALALALVAAASSRGRRRAGSLGFALFGVGSMALAFGPLSLPSSWPRHAGDQLVDAALSLVPHDVATAVPDPADPFGRSDARVRHALDRPATLGLRGEVTLGDFVGAVRAVAKGPDGRPIPVHVDPIGLMDVDRNLASPLEVDCDGIRLRTALNLALDQLTLTFRVVDGVLVITAPDRPEPDNARMPARTVGHCAFALLAACAGGLLSRRVAGPDLVAAS